MALRFIVSRKTIAVSLLREVVTGLARRSPRLREPLSRLSFVNKTSRAIDDPRAARVSVVAAQCQRRPSLNVNVNLKPSVRQEIHLPGLFIHTTMASCRRPEHKAPPEMFYNEEEARKYTSNSRMIEIQMTMSERAVELLNLPEDTPSYILDVGCGSGLSGETLTEQGHHWVGLDISTHMLDIAVEREVDGDLFVSDLGQGVFFRPGTFDGVISISALQWLCNADKKSHHPPKRLYKFFCTLYSALRRGSRAVFQFYPENSQQLELITSQAMKAGFTGGVVVDYPNSTRAKKLFLCLFAGLANPQMPKGLGTGEGERGVPTEVKYSDSRQRFRHMKGKPLKKSREWINEKKERRRRQGKGEVRPDSKYTGRRRMGKF